MILKGIMFAINYDFKVNVIKMTFALLLVLSICGYKQTNGLRFTNVTIPEVADFRDSVTLSCSYNMGNHTLNSVKWYKDDKEFFRYAPMMYPTIITFKVNGVTLLDQMHNCNKVTCSITLDNLEPSTSGTYRCEISGDAPEFKLISRTNNMTVAALPQHDPIINGLAPSYTIGDFLMANCTSDRSSLPATLAWYIDEEKASSDYLQPIQETTTNNGGFVLRSRTVEIRFRVDKTRFAKSRGIMKMKCVAIIPRFPQATREKTTKVFIMSGDDLMNQKLINWRNSATAIQFSYANFILTLTWILVILNLSNS